MSAHSEKGPSSSERWINCTPSAKLCADMPDVSTSFAQEGTDAHEVCEYELKKALGQKMACPVENLTYYNPEMQECADGYRDYVMELVEEARQRTKDVVVLVEQKIQYERFVKGGFGTADCIIIADGVLNVVDGVALEGLRITTEKVTFTGFPTAPDHDHLTAFAQLAVLMNQQAISQKRIQAKAVNDENEKYALRTWLLRLGMNGPDFKETRKILMERLSGHAAFRTDEEAQKFLAREKAKRDALKAAKQAVQEGGSSAGETVEQDATQPTQPDCGADTAQMMEAGA